jgi:hypothetical protein
MKTYIVTVEVRTVDLYKVEADTPDDAMELWQDGELIRQDFSKMDAEAIDVREAGERE